MAAVGDSISTKTHERIEIELMEALRQRQQEWSICTEANHAVGRQRFQDALRAFSGFVLHGRLPKEYLPVLHKSAVEPNCIGPC